MLSADVLRCMETIGPYAEHAQLSVESEPLLSEVGYAAWPELSVERLLEILAAGVPSVVCSQGKTIPGLVHDVCEALGTAEPVVSVRKGGLVVLHVRDGELPTIGAMERLDPVA